MSAPAWERIDRPRPDGWPSADPAVFHGPIGRFVCDAAPHTEADPIAMLATSLIMFGGALNRGPHVLAGNDRHPAALFVVIVGGTSTGAKGTSAAPPRRLFELVDPDYIGARCLSGFGSGESLVDAVRDPDGDDDAGAPPDTRLLVAEPEFARVLNAAGRDGSTLSQVIRDGWDSRPLQARSRARTSVATNHHLAVVGHITPEELRARLSSVETWSGFTNRLLFALSARSQLLPDGGNVPEPVFSDHAAEIRANLEAGRKVGRVERTGEANDYWREVYVALADDEPEGLLGAVVARGAPYVLRLALTYALADGRREIDVEHLAAAHALWRYSRSSAEVIFGDAVGDAVADQLLAAIRRAGPDGLDRTGQSNALGRNHKASRLDAARKHLEDLGQISTKPDPHQTGGRPRHISYVVTKKDE